MNTKIYSVIKERRKQLSIDQKSLARIAGISVHALSDLETGKGNPTLSTLLNVYNALGLTLTPSIKELESSDA